MASWFATATAPSINASVDDPKAALLAPTAGPDAKATAPPRVPILSLWRFATHTELWMVALGSVAAIMHGALMPLFTLLFGDVIDSFGPGNGDALQDNVAAICVRFVILGGIAGVTSYLQMMLFMATGARQAHRIRESYFRAVLRQDMAWHDLNAGAEVATRLAGYALSAYVAASCVSLTGAGSLLSWPGMCC
jgi:ABC-type multidrug transport system fused ATPase/permease subunit